MIKLPLRSEISIHALLAESDGPELCQLFGALISIHALLAESDPAVIKNRTAFSVFLSTLSLRRATLAVPDLCKRDIWISIHALLAESDPLPIGARASADPFLSTLSLRRATAPARQPAEEPAISIHALLAESDGCSGPCRLSGYHFYPRSPCGERQNAHPDIRRPYVISIHALLAESDSHSQTLKGRAKGFLSTLSLRRATITSYFRLWQAEFLSTLSLRRATGARASWGQTSQYFYPRSPCGERLTACKSHIK